MALLNDLSVLIQDSNKMFIRQIDKLIELQKTEKSVFFMPGKGLPGAFYRPSIQYLDGLEEIETSIMNAIIEDEKKDKLKKYFSDLYRQITLIGELSDPNNFELLSLKFLDEIGNTTKKLQLEIINIQHNNDTDDTTSDIKDQDLLALMKEKISITDEKILTIGEKKVNLSTVDDIKKQELDFEQYYTLELKNSRKSGKFITGLRLILSFIDNEYYKLNIGQTHIPALIKKYYKTFSDLGFKVQESIDCKGINSFANKILDRGKTTITIKSEKKEYIIRRKR